MINSKHDRVEQTWINDASCVATINKLAYQNNFDSCNTMHECIANGHIDFFHRIFKQDVYTLLGDPREKTCFEIGYGGGRLLNAALSVFKYGGGIDIIDDKSREETVRFLVSNGKCVDNFELYHRDHITKLKQESVDFLYSFIVFQHFSSHDELDQYYEMIKHILKPKGVGVIFFIRYSDSCAYEYKDIHDSRACRLFLGERYMRDYFKRDFHVVEVSHLGKKKMWSINESLQSRIVFQKV